MLSLITNPGGEFGSGGSRSGREGVVFQKGGAAEDSGRGALCAPSPSSVQALINAGQCSLDSKGSGLDRFVCAQGRPLRL